MFNVSTPVQPTADTAHRGVVTRVEDDDAWGRRLTVELDDGRTVHAQPLHVGTGARSVYVDVKVDDLCVAIPIGGSARDWIAIVAGCFEASPPPDEVASSTATLLYGPTVEAREAGGDAVEGVVLRSFLDDLSTHLGDVANAATTVAGSTPPATLPEVAAFCAEVIAAFATIATSAGTLKGKADTARNANAGKGGAPHVSPVLRAGG